MSPESKTNRSSTPGRTLVQQESPTGENVADAAADRVGRDGRKAPRTLAVPAVGHSREMPLQGPEILDLLFRLGPLTMDQMGGLLPRRIGADRLGRILKRLGVEGQVPEETGASCTDGSGPGGPPAPMVGRTRRTWRFGSRDRRTRWKMVYHLSAKGLDYVARRRDLHPSVAKSLYQRVYEDARIDHALLRNDFYRRVSLHAPRLSPDGLSSPGGLHIETLWAESGMTPIRLLPLAGKGRRFLNPDGILELVTTGSSRYGLKLYIESDTGSEDMPWQIASHADKYAEHLFTILDGKVKESPPGIRPPDDLSVPRVLFVSPGPQRTRWVRRTIRENGLNPESVFYSVLTAFKEKGYSLPSLFWFTNLQWLDEAGPLGASYWPLSSADLETLIEVT